MLGRQLYCRPCFLPRFHGVAVQLPPQRDLVLGLDDAEFRAFDRRAAVVEGQATVTIIGEPSVVWPK